MRCPRCNGQGMNVTTERGSFSTLVRNWKCSKGHRFNTIETYMPTQPVEKHMLLSALRAIARAFGLVKESRRAGT
jgi:transcriptional regulator NrdR family protein